MLLESMPVSREATTIRALPQTPSTTAVVQRPCPELPPSDAVRSSFEDAEGHYADIGSVFAGRGAGTNGGTNWRVSSIDDPYHYIDIDRPADQSGGDGNQNVSHSGYEGLDRAVVQALRQRSHDRQDYVRLGAVDEVADADDAAERVEMTEFDVRGDGQNEVCLPAF